jgi:hypothetical protein
MVFLEFIRRPGIQLQPGKDVAVVKDLPVSGIYEVRILVALNKRRSDGAILADTARIAGLRGRQWLLGRPGLQGVLGMGAAGDQQEKSKGA